MKHLLCLLWFISSFTGFSQNLSTQVNLIPTEPKVGQKVQLIYRPDQPSTTAKLSCYLYQNADQTRVTILPLQNKNQQYEAEFILGAETKSFLMVFHDSSGVIDSNHEGGYWSPVYANGKLVAGARSTMADMYSCWHHNAFSLAQRFDLSLDLYQKEFVQNPYLKRNHLIFYLMSMKGVNNFNKNQFKRELQGFVLYDDLTEVEMRFLAKFYAEINENTTARELNKKRHEKYPKDRSVIEEANRDFHIEFAREKSFSKKKEMYDAFCARYNDLEDSITVKLNQFKRGTMLARLAVYYLKENRFDEWEIELSKLNAVGQRTSLYLGSSDLVNKDSYLENAEILAKRACVFELKNLKEPRYWNEPLYMTDEEVNHYRRKYAAWVIKNYGVILMKNNKLALADSVLKEAAYTYAFGEHTEINETYIDCLIKRGKTEQAEEEARRFVSTQKSSPHIDAFLNQLKKSTNLNSTVSINNFKNRVPVSLINQPLSDFYFVDTLGKQVTKESLKGKVVVIDCWATWCNSCIIGFEGMYNLTKKYGKADVVFLFLNTLEFGGNVEEKAKKLIKSKGYDFTIVFDQDNVAVDNLKVNSLPTKFIIDKDGNIRFRQEGEAEGSLEKLDTVIEKLIK